MSKLYNKSSAYSVVYSDMAGVDFTAKNTASGKRFAYLENMYRDYGGTDYRVIESIPGFRCVSTLGTAIHALYSYESRTGDDILVIHANDGIYTLNVTRGDASPIRVASASSDKSSAVRFNSRLYLFAGALYVFDDGAVGTVDNITDYKPYLPTTFINGEEYERINLINSRFLESYTLGSAAAYSYGSPGLEYIISDVENKYCSVTGYSGTDASVYIPSRVKLGGEYYAVKKIDARAFYANGTITELTVAEGVTEIGTLAFYKCTSLARVKTPSTLCYIGGGAFSDCAALISIYLGEALIEIGNSAFSMVTRLTSVHFGGGEEDFAKVVNNTAIGDVSVTYNSPARGVSLFLPLHTPTKSVRSVTVGGESRSFKFISSGDEVGIRLDFVNRSICEGKEIVIEAERSYEPEDYRAYGGILASEISEDLDPSEAIFKAECAAVFDGRIFLSGIPEARGLIFFSGRNKSGDAEPTYFPDTSYFIDGDGSFPVVSICPCGGMLAVFISGADSTGGAIYYHEPRETGIRSVPKIYPVVSSHIGLGKIGAAISFFDDPLFVTKNGICALRKSNISLDRSIEICSHNVNPRLLLEDISRISLAVWHGYLVVLCGERIYLADSRDVFRHETGSTEYEWYFLSGIGAYKNDAPVYRYTPGGGGEPDGICKGEIYSEADDEGNIIYYTPENGVKIPLYKTEERWGGDFFPASLMTAIGDRLAFVTEGSHICIFNNDKRGVAPDSIASAEGFDKAEYEAAYKGRIHPLFYSFAGHAPRYAMRTSMDNCGLPNLLKDTEKRSLTLKCKAMSEAKIVCEVGTDRSGYSEACSFPAGSLSFADISFSSLSLTADDSFTALVSEKEKGWLEKEIAVYSEGFASPFGIYSIAYRYKIRGRLRKKNNA